MCPTSLCTLLIIFLTLVRTPCLRAVRGCVTYVAGADYSMKQSICDKPDTHFKVVPSALPSQVVKLTINHQEITRLNASQFTHLPNLTYLDLDSNKLSIIHPDTFRQLRQLRTLSLRFNLLTFSVDSFHPAAVHGLTQLEHLNLLHNPIGYIPNDFFAPLGTTLKSLVLAGSSGPIQLDTSSLGGLYMLQSLDLSSNRLETLPESFERSLNSMQLNELYLYDNPWRCDCHLRWLKLWFLKHSHKLKFSRIIPEVVERRLAEVSKNTWMGQPYDGVEESATILQPKCASPYSLYGRSIFDQSGSVGTHSLRSADFHCAPKSLTPRQSLHFIRGDNATMTCEFLADPTGYVVWYQNGTKIQSHSSRIHIEQSQGKRFHSKLFITEAQLSDAGSYVCFLDTGYGRVNSTLFVHISNEDHSFASFMSSNIFQWFSDLNTRDVLKYTGVAASCLILVLMLIGLIAYCSCGKHVCSEKKTRKSSDIDKTNKPLDSEGLIDEWKHEDITPKDSLPESVNLRANMIRIPRSTLVKRSSIKKNQELLATVNQLGGVQLLPARDNTETNYVAFRIVPNGTKANLKHECAIHNYALIQPIVPDGLLLQDQMTASANFSARGQSVTAEGPTLIPSLINSCDLSHPTINSELAGADINHIVSHFAPQDTNTTPNLQHAIKTEGSYSSCPLHGDIYATLHNADQKSTFTQINRVISTVPTGLESTFEKRTHTMPNRRKTYIGVEKPGEQISIIQCSASVCTAEATTTALDTSICTLGKPEPNPG